VSLDEKSDRLLILKIDMHVHTWHSDSRASVDEVLDVAYRKGLDGVAITDHNIIDGALEAEKKSGDLIIIPGEEVTTLDGELIALGIREPIPKGLPARRVVKIVHSQGGIIVVPHPTVPFVGRFSEEALRRLDIDGVEVFSAITPLPGYFLRRNVELARRLGVAVLAGSDSHFAQTVGDAYTIIYSEGSSVEKILEAIKMYRTKVGCKPSDWIFKARMLRGFFASLPKALLGKSITF